jgi:hypothetical protein
MRASRTVKLPAVGVAAALALLGFGVQSGSVSAAPTAAAPSPGSFTGERQGSGPVTGRVDADHASPAAARAAAMTAHDHMAMGGSHMDMDMRGSPMVMGGDAKAGAAPRTAAAAPSAAAAALDPAVYGQWSTLSYKLPLRAVHATLLRTGNFLLIAGSGNVANDNVIKNFKAYLWNPTTGALTSLPVPYDAFCAGHLVDANGDVLVFGGTVRYEDSSGPWTGSEKAYKFVVATNTWVPLPSMRQARWYPTAIMDGQGRSFAFSGYDSTGATPTTPEMFDPRTGTWTNVATRKLPLYPGLHLLADGRFAYTGAHFGYKYNTVAPSVFDPITGRNTVVADPNAVVDIKRRNMAMSALVGSADKQLAWVAGGLTAVASTYFIDFSATAPKAVAGPRLAAAKGYVSVSHLPDLTAFETGGGAGTNSPVYEASILDPTSRTLTAMAPPTVPRTYHSSSVTTPDGRVVTFGGDPKGDANFELRVEIFSPPYLFKGTRPTITSSPTEVSYGGSYTVGATAAAGLDEAVIMRPGSATHSMDANQRVLKLASTVVDGGLQVSLPSNRNLAPPGWYLMFVGDSVGRPSVGTWVHLT